MTTEKFLTEFGFESLRDLPDFEALKDAGLMRADSPPDAGAEEAEAEGVPDGLSRREVSRDRVA